VRHRQTKGEFSHALVEALEALGGVRVWADMDLARAGWIVPGPLVEAYRRMMAQYRAGDDQYGDATGSLWLAASIELWWRTAQSAPPSRPVPSRAPTKAASAAERERR
jgi:hypothetical protein